jgi:hypothetical protein
MKYSKPQIINTEAASFAIMGGQKASQPVDDNPLTGHSIGAYSADE